ncbi:polysaccharide deacetylase family protein [Nonomuraea sp. NPDC050790]|uniref:polysaccharide deacetylase family protein n=1 Tax=Nonomuraea sp. NPDC050790 TaxID=3364371 RepID=UPI0037978DA3
MTWRDTLSRSRRTVHWPQGQYAAATIGVALEAFENQSQLRLAGRPGQRDSFSLSYGEYGVRVGVWRLLELFDDLAVKASFSVSGRLARDWPDVVKAVADAGHDLVGHGWVNDVFLNEADAGAERDIIVRTLDAIEKAAGTRPTGWASPANSSTERTKQIMVDSGLTWSGDDASDDLPYVEPVGDGRLAVLPKTNLSANDLIHWILPTNSPQVFAEGFADTLAVAWAEGEAGRPQWADMVLHCHMAGRPAFLPTLRRCLLEARRRERVWWTTKDTLAAWTLENGFAR